MLLYMYIIGRNHWRNFSALHLIHSAVYVTIRKKIIIFAFRCSYNLYFLEVKCKIKICTIPLLNKSLNVFAKGCMKVWKWGFFFPNQRPANKRYLLCCLKKNVISVKKHAYFICILLNQIKLQGTASKQSQTTVNMIPIKVN